MVNVILDSTFQDSKFKDIIEFITKGLDLAIDFFGKDSSSVIPSQTTIYIKYGSPMCTKQDNNQYTIHLNNLYSVWAQLGHEIPHILNTNLFDTYVEGFNTLFSEILCKTLNKSFSEWEQYYKDNLVYKGNNVVDHFYAWTFFMMREINGLIAKEERHLFLKCAVEGGYSQVIDIDKWILNLENREKVLLIIKKYSDGYTYKMRDSYYQFIVPKELKTQ
ncbi:hypothetical protein ABK040_004001 [Willaertia magna]